MSPLTICGPPRHKRRSRHGLSTYGRLRFALDKPDSFSQQWLLPYRNPLTERFGREFFLKIPKTSGVYFFYGESEFTGRHLLYVGKAKNLRARLNSYRHAKPGAVSRKVLRMVNLARFIEWEECETETAALLRENQLLREKAPPFNRMNTRPDTYYFVGVRFLSDEVRFRLTMTEKRQGDLLYGAFKARGLVQDGYQALLRLLWASQSREERFEFPQRLVARRAAALYSVKVPQEWHGWIKEFFAGQSSQLLRRLTEQILENPTLPPFYYRWVQEDLETALRFFYSCTLKNRQLKKSFSVRSRLIHQEQVDDLLVLERGLRRDLLPQSDLPLNSPEEDPDSSEESPPETA